MGSTSASEEKKVSGIAKVGLVGIFGGVVSLIGIQAELMPDFVMLDVQGIVPPAMHAAEDSATLHTVNMSTKRAENIGVTIRQVEHVIHTASAPLIELGKHRPFSIPPIQDSDAVTVCMTYNETIFGFWTIQSWGKWTL